jgi:hypothetical protein
MDVKAFGSVYGQTSSLPYGSGFEWLPASGRKNFPVCRGIFIEAKANSSKDTLSVELADAPNQNFIINNLQGDQLLALACTAVLSGTVNAVFILY